jgi:CRISPR-associated protein Cmr2
MILMLKLDFNMPQHLFIFSIGPVQSFIAQARKAQDLWAGSQLLSDLITKTIVQAKATSNTFDCIFPYETAKSKPNRFVAKVEVDNIKDFGDNLKIWINDELLRIAKSSFKDSSFYNLAKSQLADFLEVYWAAVPYDEANYVANYGLLERTLGAVKNYRAYNQFSEQGRKCVMNGFYNALFYKRIDAETDTKTSLQDRKFLDKKGLVFPDDERHLEISKLQKGEGICGVSFLKRFYKSDKQFPSVANVALMHLWQNDSIKNSDELFQMLICDGKSVSTIDEFNAQLLYSENINEDYWKEQEITKCTVACADDNLRKLTTKVKEQNLKFNKYYAAMIFDADNMGSKISSCLSIEQHKNLSKRLSDYADWARDYVDRGRGKTIYAGGDDFMGILNLNTLFETIENLRKEFGNRFNTEGLTFSAGIAIAHYKAPLSEVLNYARKMEQQAKDRDGKNAFSIAVLKHSGEIHEMVLPWSKKDDTTGKWFTTFLKEINEDLKEDISPKFVKVLNEELAIWEDAPSSFRLMANYEIDRLINRSKKTSDVVKIKRMQDNVKDIYKEVSSREITITYFINAINVADFINRKM